MRAEAEPLRRAALPAYVLALLAGAAAAEGGASPAVSVQTLGTVQATIDYCVAADAAHGEDYRQRARLFLNGASDDDLAGLRASKEYRAAYEAAKSAMRQMGGDEALKTCREMLQNEH